MPLTFEEQTNRRESTMQFLASNGVASKPIKDFIETEFKYKDSNDKDFLTTHFVKDYTDKKGETQKGGSKSSLTLADYRELSETGVVSSKDNWKPKIQDNEGEYYEVRPCLANQQMCIVDFDGWKESGDITLEQLMDMDELPEIFAACSFFVSRTKSLPHFIFYITDLPENIKTGNYINVIKGFEADILFNHAWERRHSSIFNYGKEGLITISWNDLKCIIDPDKPNSKKLIPAVAKPKPNPKPKPQKDGDDMSEVTHVTAYDSKTCEKQNKKIKEIKLLFQAILETTPTFFDTYSKWSEIGYLIHNETNGSLEGCELFRELTKEDVPYPEVCKQYYATQKSRDKSNQLKIASLKAWLKQENPDHVLLLGSKDEHFVDNDDGAINLIMEGLKSRFIFTNDQMYFKQENLWVKDKPMIMDFLMKHILESKIYKSNKHNELVSYCQNVGTCKSVREGLLAKLSVSTRDDTLYERFHSSTKNKLCFNDGVLDFVEKSFTLWDDIPPNTIFATVIINRNYADYFKKQNTKFIDAINSDIIGNLFGNKSKLAKQFFSRAITGNIQDKNFASYCGNRDCGKGILYALFATAFGGYVAPFAIQNMTCERESKKSSDLAKENAWLIPLQYARLAIAQETDDNENDDISNKLKINNKVMKTVMSGGDTILARELWQSPIRFTIDATLAIFGNNELSITNSDSAQHHLKFNGIKQFVTQEAYNKHLKMGEHFASAYAVRDETLKDKVKTDDYANAMVHILYSEYVDKSICIHNAENEDGERVLTLREMLFDKFEFTGNDKDRISKVAVYSVVKGDKKKIIAELDSLGCVGDSKSCKVVVTTTDESGKVTKKQEQAFKGIVFKEEAEEEQIDEPEVEQ